MTSSSIFDTFGDFLPSSWVDRGIVRDFVNESAVRTKSRIADRGFDLLRFLSIATLAISAPASSALSQTIGGPSYSHTGVTLPGSSSIQAGSLFTITSTHLIPAVGGSSRYTVDSAPQTYNFESKVSSIDALSLETTGVIGQNGISRLHKFSQLPVGWDNGYGETLSARSLNNFDAFMRAAHISPNRASVFMTHSGYVVLNWLDSAGHVTELEFRDREIAYFDELKDHEITLALSDAAKLKELLNLPELSSGIVI